MDKTTIAFKLPCNILIIGETNSGKSVILKKLCLLRDKLFDPAPERFLLAYSKYQPLYTELESQVPGFETMHGIQKDRIENLDKPTILCFDDLMQEMIEDPYVAKIMTQGRHFNIQCVIGLWHQIFPKGRFQRLINCQVHAYILLRSPRVSSQLGTLASQLGHTKLIKGAYKAATENKPFSYLVVDFSNKTDPDAEKYAIRSSCLDEVDPLYVYRL